MTQLEELYRIADQENIAVDCFPLKSRAALSYMVLTGECSIAIDPGQLSGPVDEKMKLSHELGHCMTGSFYNVYSNYDCRERHENTADKWAIRKLVPKNELSDALNSGCQSLWELSEYFCVPEKFIKKAVCYYTYGNVADDQFF